MNCLIFNPYGNLEGEGWKDYRSTMIAKAMVRRNHKCTIFAPPIEHRTKQKRDLKRLKEIAVRNGYEIHFSLFFIKYSNRKISRVFHELFYSFSFLFSFLFKREFRKYTHIICVEPAPFSSWLIHLLKRFSGFLLVYDVLDLFPETLKTTENKYLNIFIKPLQKIRTLRLSDADAIIYCSKTFRDSLGISKVASEIIYLGCDNGNDSKSMESNSQIVTGIKSFLTQSSIKIIYAGSYGDGYGLDVLINKIKLCIEDGLDIRLCLVGLGDEKQISRVNECIGGSLFIRDFGAVSSEQLKYIYALFDIGVISYAKGTSVAMPIKFFDYMAHELLIINNCPGEVSEIIERSLIGANFNPCWDGLNSYLSSFKNNKVGNAKKLRYEYMSDFQHEKLLDFIEEV